MPYDFLLAPNNDPLRVERLLNVQTLSSNIGGGAGGLLGWIANIITNVILFFLNDYVVSNIRTEIQTIIDQEVQDALAAENVPAGATASVRNITITANEGITIRAVGAAGQEIACSANFSTAALRSSAVQLRASEQMRKLYLMRDRVLRGTLLGDAYIKAFYAHNSEIKRILTQHPDILKHADAVVAAGLREYDGRSPGRGVLSPETTRLGVQLMERVARVASPELALTIQHLIPEVESFVGKPVASVLSERERQIGGKRRR